MGAEPFATATGVPCSRAAVGVDAAVAFAFFAAVAACWLVGTDSARHAKRASASLPPEKASSRKVDHAYEAALACVPDTLPTRQMARRWHMLDIAWRGGRDTVVAGLPRQTLSPAWQLLMLGDGSPTRHLRLLTGMPTAVDVLEMQHIGDADDGAPDAIACIPKPRVRRQVWLQTNKGDRLGYATSWWPAELVDAHLQNQSVPIWNSLGSRRTELFRDVLAIYRGRHGALAEAFKTDKELWGRHYLFWHAGRPLCLIYEVFSPVLEQYLGPQSPPSEM